MLAGKLYKFLKKLRIISLRIAYKDLLGMMVTHLQSKPLSPGLTTISKAVVQTILYL